MTVTVRGNNFATDGSNTGMVSSTQLGFMSSADKTKLDAALTATSGALTLYVATTGNDSNDGLTAGTPLLTVQAAINKIPQLIKHAVTVNIAAGTYTQDVQLFGFIFGGEGALTLLGTTANATVATGTATGTVSSSTAVSASALQTVTDTTQSWTVNDLRGKFFTVGGSSRVIVSNTATTVTLTSSGTITNGSAYSITTNTTNLVAATSPALYITGDTTNLHAALLNYQLTNINFSCSLSTGAALFLQSATPGSSRASNCTFTVTGTTSSIAVSVLAGQLQLVNCFVDGYNRCLRTSTINAIGSLSTNYFLARNNSGPVVSLTHVGTVACAGTVVECLGTTGSGALVSIAGCNSVTNSLNGLWLFAPTGAAYTGLALGSNTLSDGSWDTVKFQIIGIAVQNTATGISVTGNAVFMTSGTVNMTGVTTAFQLTTGGTVRLPGATLSLGAPTTEINLEGVAYTVATMDAATPQVIADLNTGSRIMRL